MGTTKRQAGMTTTSLWGVVEDRVKSESVISISPPFTGYPSSSSSHSFKLGTVVNYSKENQPTCRRPRSKLIDTLSLIRHMWSRMESRGNYFSLLV